MNTTTPLISLTLTTALLAGCGSSSGPHHEVGQVGAPVSTRTLGPLVQDTVALPGLAEGQAAAAVGDFALVTGGSTARESASTRVTELELGSGQTRPRADRMVVARSGHVLLFSLQGEWLALGGVDATGRPLSSIERYDPASEAWVLDERTLPIAGRLTSTISDDHLSLATAGHAFVEIFDLETLVWTGSFPLAGSPKEAPVLIHLAGRDELIYAHSEFPAFIEMDSGRGAAFPGELVPQGGTSVLPVADFGVLFVGGRDEEGQPIRRARYFELLATETVEVGPELPAVEGASAAWLADGSILVAGGTSDGRLLDRALRFDLEGVVERLAPLGEARDRITVLQSAGRVALIGGRGVAGPSSLIDVFSFSELAPTQAFAEAARNRQRKFDQLATIKDLRADRAEAEVELSDLIAQVGATQASLDQATSRRDVLTLELRRAEAARVKVEAEVARLGAEERRLVAARDQLQAAARRDQQALTTTQADLDLTQLQLSAAQAEASRQQARTTGLQGQLSQAQGQVSAARQDLTQIQTQSAQQAAANQAAANQAAATKAAANQVIAAPKSTPSYGAVIALNTTTGTSTTTATTGSGTRTTTTTSNAPTTNYGGVYSLDSILARLNGSR